MKKYLALLLSMLLLVGCARIEPEQGGTKPEPGQPDDVSAKLLSQYALAEVKLPELPAEPSEEELWTAYEKLDYDKMGEDAYHKAQEELWDDFDARSRAYSDAVKALRGEGVDKTMTPALLGYSTKTVSKLLGGEEAANVVYSPANLYRATRFVNNLVYAGVGIVGAFFAIHGMLSVGRLTSFLSYANQYTKPFNEISGVITELQNAIACAARVFELMEAEPQEPDKPDAIELTQVKGAVELKNVSFSYVPEQKLIRDFNLTVKPGQRVAIVGPTGCGKTTVINLLMRFYDVNKGVIAVDGTDIRNMTRASLRSNIGMVLQETWLKDGTIRDNIIMGRPDATEEEIIAAAKATHAHSFIKRLPQGYDTVVREDGDNLSQGQKQLLCITRVMLCQPPMLILDEATSSIDTRTEIRIQRAFEKLMKGRTSFIVAHRLSTIKNADIILVMKDGNIIEQGSHESLLAQNGFYANLYNSQFA